MGIAERKEREKEQRRNDIVNAAERVFFTRGIDAATMDDIAEEAELSKGTLYLYFKSKDELLFAVDLRALKIIRDMFLKAIDIKKDSIENLMAIGNAYVQFSRKYENYFRTLLHFEGDEIFNKKHELFEQLCNHEDDPMTLFIKLLERGMEDGSIRSDIHASQLAHILWSSTTGILRLSKTKKFHSELDDFSEDDIINNHFEIIRNGIRNNQNKD